MRGGKRTGAGRPKGTPNPDTVARRELANKAIAQGITPLEVLLTTMRDAWSEASNEDLSPTDRLTLRSGACAIAKDAAPYVHPKLANTEHTGKDGGDLVVKVMKCA